MLDWEWLTLPVDEPETTSYRALTLPLCHSGRHKIILLTELYVSLGGLVTCLPRDPRFMGSNLAEVDGFFQDIKILSTSPSGGTLGWGPEPDFRLVK